MRVWPSGPSYPAAHSHEHASCTHPRSIRLPSFYPRVCASLLVIVNDSDRIPADELFNPGVSQIGIRISGVV